MKELHKKNILLLIAGTTLFGFVFNYLLNDKILGISDLILVILYYGLFITVCYRIIDWKNWFGWFLVIPVIILSSTFFLTSNPILRTINTFLVPLLLFIQSIVFTNAHAHQWYRGMFIFDVLDRVARSFGNIFSPYKAVGSKRESGILGLFGLHTFNKVRIVKALVITLPILAIVIALLMSADEAFKQILNDFAEWIGFLNWWNFFDDIVLVIVITLITGGFMWTLLREHRRRSEISDTEITTSFDTVLFTLLLGGLNLVYFLFVFVQFVYLFGGEQNIALREITYSEYAVKGFWELMVVSILNIGILVVSSETTKKASVVMQRVVSTLGTVVGVNSLILAYSAHIRLSLYQQTYGFTYQRIFAHTIIILLAILIVCALVKVWYKKVGFVQVFVVASLSMYVLLNCINVDLVIAKKNIERFEQTGKLDTSYLTGLSMEVNEYLYDLAQNNPSIQEKTGGFIFLDKIRNDVFIYGSYHDSQWMEYNRSWQKTQELYDRITENIDEHNSSYNTWFTTQFTSLNQRAYDEGDFPRQDNVEALYNYYKYVDGPFDDFYNNYYLYDIGQPVVLSSYIYPNSQFSSTYYKTGEIDDFRQIPYSELSSGLVTIQDVDASLVRQKIAEGACSTTPANKFSNRFDDMFYIESLRDGNEFNSRPIFTETYDVYGSNSERIVGGVYYPDVVQAFLEGGERHQRVYEEYELVTVDFMLIKSDNIYEVIDIVRDNYLTAFKNSPTINMACRADGLWVIDII